MAEVSWCAAHCNRSCILSTGWLTTWNDAGKTSKTLQSNFPRVFKKIALELGPPQLALNNALLLWLNTDIREWGVVRMTLDGANWELSISTTLWMMCITFHCKWWLWSKLVQTAFLEWCVCRFTLINKFQSCYYKLLWSDAHYSSLPIYVNSWMNVIE